MHSKARWRGSRFAWQSVSLVCALALLAGCQPKGDDTGEAGAPEAGRYTFNRGHNVLIRLDSASGQVWFVPEGGEGGWTPLGETPNDEGKPIANGRFTLFVMSAPRGTSARGEGSFVQLLRVDLASGYTWLAEVRDGGEWIPIKEPEGAGPGETTAPTDTLAASEPPSAAQHEPTTHVAPAAETDEVVLPVVPREVMDASGGASPDDIEIIIEALHKEALPVNIRVWAASQLGVMEKERAVPALIEALDDDQPEVVIASIRSLQQIGDASTIPRILKLGQHPDARVRQTVAEVVKEVR